MGFWPSTVGVGGDRVSWAGRRVLVTGAAGLLGHHLCRELVGIGSVVVGLDRAWADHPSPVAGVDVRHGDVCGAGVVTDALQDVDTVFHFAAQALVDVGRTDPVGTFRDNVDGTIAVLEACRQAGGIKRIVVASSDKAYGDLGGVEYDEAMPLNAREPYEVSKACADLLARSYASSFSMPIGVSRCGNLFGGADVHWSRLVPGTVRSVLRGEVPVIRSNGTPIRDYLYVADAVQGLLLFAEALGAGALRGQALNFAGAEGARMSALEMVTLVCTTAGVDGVPDVVGSTVGEIPEQRVSSERARQELGWVASTTVAEGLAATLAWYREHLEVR